jgi:hypothetical protein
MTQVLNFFYFIRSPSVALTLFFLLLKKFGLTCDIALAIDISLFKLFFVLLKKKITFDIWFIMIRLFICFNVRFIVLLRSHILDHGFHMLTIINSSQSNMSPSQYFFKKKYIIQYVTI